MPSVSSLAALYEAVYHEPPSSHSTAALAAMELILGIAPEDPLARMLIVLLHSNDRLDTTVKRLDALVASSEDILRRLADREEEVAGLIDKLAIDLTNLSFDLQRARNVLRRRRPTPQIAGFDGEVVIDTDRRASPMAAYLARAFRGYTSVIEEARATTAARIDLLFLVAIGAILLAIGMAASK